MTCPFHGIRAIDICPWSYHRCSTEIDTAFSGTGPYGWSVYITCGDFDSVHLLRRKLTRLSLHLCNLIGALFAIGITVGCVTAEFSSVWSKVNTYCQYLLVLLVNPKAIPRSSQAIRRNTKVANTLVGIGNSRQHFGRSRRTFRLAVEEA
jgi:hypothetical protein